MEDCGRDVGGPPESGVRVAARAQSAVDDVRLELGKEKRRSRSRRRLRVDDMGQRRIVHLDELCSVLRLVAVTREDERDRLAGESRTPARQGMLRRLSQPVDREEIDERNVGEIGRREDGHDTVHPPGRVRVDPRDVRVGERRADEGRMKPVREGQICEEAPSPGQEPRILEARHAPARPAAGKRERQRIRGLGKQARYDILRRRVRDRRARDCRGPRRARAGGSTLA